MSESHKILLTHQHVFFPNVTGFVEKNVSLIKTCIFPIKVNVLVVFFPPFQVWTLQTEVEVPVLHREKTVVSKCCCEPYT